MDPRRGRRATGRGSRSGRSTRWIAWNLTGGAAHVTDVTNASRTMLLDLATGDWDDELLELFSVDRVDAARGGARRRASSPRRRCSARPCRSPGIAGDQQAALFGQGCFAPGE